MIESGNHHNPSVKARFEGNYISDEDEFTYWYRNRTTKIRDEGKEYKDGDSNKTKNVKSSDPETSGKGHKEEIRSLLLFPSHLSTQNMEI